MTSLPSGSFRQRLEDLRDLGVAALALLREHELAVRDHVELALLARDDLGAVRGSVQLGRETRGPAVIAVSDGAEEDFDAGHLA